MTTTAVHETITTPALTVSDRCDRCGAQAFVRVELNKLDLLFCGHDYTANELSLVAKGAEVVEDARSTINAKPSQSSA